MTRDLVVRRESKTYPGLFVKKYDRKVFYDNLWTPQLVECRGHVETASGEIVVRPFTKIFNRFENKTDIHRDDTVVAVQKVNGFMAAVTWIPQIKQCVVSTTGSLDSDFVAMAKSKLTNDVYECVSMFDKDPYTFMFEIVHEDDPHVVPEKAGAYLLGMRRVGESDGYFSSVYQEKILDAFAIEMGVFRPKWRECSFESVVNESKVCKHEGFVVYSQTSGTCLKIKSPYYLITKFLGRLSKNKMEQMADNPLKFKSQVDEEFYPLLEKLNEVKDEFTQMDEQQRMAFIRGVLGGL